MYSNYYSEKYPLRCTSKTFHEFKINLFHKIVLIIDPFVLNYIKRSNNILYTFFGKGKNYGNNCEIVCGSYKAKYLAVQTFSYKNSHFSAQTP